MVQSANRYYLLSLPWKRWEAKLLGTNDAEDIDIWTQRADGVEKKVKSTQQCGGAGTMVAGEVKGASDAFPTGPCCRDWSVLKNLSSLSDWGEDQQWFYSSGRRRGGALNTLAQSSGLYGRRTVNLASNNVYHGINDKCSCLRASVHQRVRCILKSSGVAT